MDTSQLLGTLFPEHSCAMYDCGKYFAFMPRNESAISQLQIFNPETKIYHKIIEIYDHPDEAKLNLRQINARPDSRTFGSNSYFLLSELCSMAHRLDPDYLFVDVGAFAGTYALDVMAMAQYAHKSRPRAILFEPGPIFKLLQPNFKLNNWDSNVSYIQAAASDLDGHLLLRFNIGDNVSATIGKAKTQFSSLVPSVRLDSVLQHEKENFMFIKFDCQGMEYKVFDGCSSFVHKSNAVYFAEFVPHAAFSLMKSSKTYMQFLEDFYVWRLDYSTQCIEFFSPENLIKMYEKTLSSHWGYCDLVLISRKAPAGTQIQACVTEISAKLRSSQIA